MGWAHCGYVTCFHNGLRSIRTDSSPSMLPRDQRPASALTNYFFSVCLIAFLSCAGCDSGGTQRPTDDRLDPGVSSVADKTDVGKSDATEGAAAAAPDQSASAKVPTHAGPIRLEEIAKQAGVEFVHRSGAQGNFTNAEVTTGGVCLADLDGDGDLDIYLPQGGTVPGDNGEPGKNALYLNDGSGKFTDVSADSGADDSGYGMGAFAADVDSDGDLDLLLTNVGGLTLLENDGNAKFKDVTDVTGIKGADGFWLNAAIADLDGDGQLDIYVANYTTWDPAYVPKCKGPGGEPDFCNPTSYEGASDLLLLGDGQGGFRDVTKVAGIASAATRSMGVATFDLEGDGDLDIYVANDGQANLLWVNQSDGTFKDEAMVRGAALNGAGLAEASMGVACADFDLDGDEDLILTHLEKETNTLYRNEDGFFIDASARSGMAWSSPDTAFGIVLVDLNHDPYLDMFVANGAVARPRMIPDPDRPYAQVDRLIRGEKGGRLATATTVDGENAMTGLVAAVSRGVAYGDVDGDGLVDILVSIKDGPVRLYRNATETNHAWIGIRPVRKQGGADVIHAKVELQGTSQRQLAIVRPHSSYLASSEATIRFGLAGYALDKIAAIVEWPDGFRESFEGLDVNQVHVVVRGSGQVEGESTGATVDGGSGSRISATTSESDGSSEVGSNAAQAIADPKSLGSFPKLSVRKTSKYREEVSMDDAALARWCAGAGLPRPPEPNALDAPTWKLVHPAIELAGRSPDERSLGKLAMFYDGHQVTESAIVLYERLTELVPLNANWWHLLGRAQLDVGQADAAVTSFAKARELQSESVPTLGRLAEAHLAAGKPEAAFKLWKAYTAAAPQEVFGHVGQARAAEQIGDLSAAMSSAKSALQLNPKARSALVLASRVALRDGDSQSADRYSQAASQLTKADDPILKDGINSKMHAFSRSVNYLQKSVIFYKSNGKFKKALTDAVLLAERRPEKASNWQMLVWLTTVLKQPDKAAEYARVAIEVDPNFAPGWETIARSELKAGKTDDALKSADMAIKYDPRYHGGYVTRGMILTTRQRWADALGSLDKGLARQPKEINAMQLKALCHLQLGEREKAKATVDQMLSLVPNHPWARKIRPSL